MQTTCCQKQIGLEIFLQTNAYSYIYLFIYLFFEAVTKDFIKKKGETENQKKGTKGREGTRDMHQPDLNYCNTPIQGFNISIPCLATTSAMELGDPNT